MCEKVSDSKRKGREKGIEKTRVCRKVEMGTSVRERKRKRKIELMHENKGDKAILIGKERKKGENQTKLGFLLITKVV